MPDQPTHQTGKSGLSITALVLGILSIVTFLIWFISIPLAILAIIFGAVSLKSSGKAKAGLILGIIGLVLSIVVIAVIFTVAPSLQASQRDTARKNDVSQISTYITSYQVDNRGALPASTSIPASYLSYVTSIKDSGNPTTTTAVYTVGIDCSGLQTSPRSYAVSILLESGSIYCQNY